MVFMFRFIVFSSIACVGSGSMFRVYWLLLNIVIKYSFLVVAVEAGLSVYVVGGQGVRLFVVVVSCGVLDVFLLGGFLSRHVCDLC